MDYKSQSEHNGLLRQFRDNIQQGWDHDRENRRDQASDMAFLAGDQWPDAARRERESEDRPMLTVNKLPQFLRQVTNDIRQADLAIKVKPVGGDDDEEMAKIYNGIISQIHYRSDGSRVLATASEHSAGGGLGWVRVKTDYEDEKSFDQEILLEEIPNPLSVVDDPAAKKPDRSDAMWRCVLQTMPRSKFEETYPKARVSEIDYPDHDNNTSRLFWQTSDTVTIAEYWRRVPKQREIAQLFSGQVKFLDELNPIEQMQVAQTRKTTTHAVEQYIISGEQILEGPHPWAGKYIPIVPVLGGEFPLEKRVIRYGLVRFAREPQQLYNLALTAQAETIGLQPKSPYVGTLKQFDGLRHIWDNAGRTNYPYLPYTPDPLAPGPPKREPPPQIAPAFVQLGLNASEDLKSTTGIYDASLGQQSNETSGRAILARDHQGDTANFHFIDNLKLAMAHVGRIIIDLIPKIYDNERIIRITNDDETEEVTTINQMLYSIDGVAAKLRDLSTAKFDVRVTVGKSYTTKRLEAADSLMQFISAVPQAGQVSMDLIAKTQDWPMADELSKRLKKLVAMQFPGMVEPDEDQPPMPPDPQEEQAQQLQQAGAEAEIAEMQAKTAKTEAETRKTNIEADRAEVETAMQVASMPPNGLPPGESMPFVQ